MSADLVRRGRGAGKKKESLRPGKESRPRFRHTKERGLFDAIAQKDWEATIRELNPQYLAGLTSAMKSLIGKGRALHLKCRKGRFRLGEKKGWLHLRHELCREEADSRIAAPERAPQEEKGGNSTFRREKNACLRIWESWCPRQAMEQERKLGNDRPWAKGARQGEGKKPGNPQRPIFGKRTAGLQAIGSGRKKVDHEGV